MSWIKELRCEKRMIVSLVFISTILSLQMSIEARPHIRHHRLGSHCSRCGPGWGVIKSCARGHDTECGKCSAGTYSPHHNSQPCWICSRCGLGLYEAHHCTPEKDTICDSCHRRSPDNPDFQSKCKGQQNFFLAPEDAESTGEETILVNQDNGLEDLKDREEILEKDLDLAEDSELSYA